MGAAEPGGAGSLTPDGAARREPPRVVAYFSMEIALEPELPTYAGGLGVLAGDTLAAAADLGLPMVGVTLVHRQGYFRQRLDAQGRQVELPAPWSPEQRLERTAARTVLELAGRPVHVGAWRYTVTGEAGFTVPVYLLDTDMPENDAQARRLTDVLYGGDERYRLQQEAVLGLGGAAILSALGHDTVRIYHMNEGHSALLGLALLEAGRGERPDWPTDSDLDAVRRQCVFTTHTPVPAGHDRFPVALVREILGEARTRTLERLSCCLGQYLNMTYAALHFSHYLNGVTMRHREVSHGMFPGHAIDAVTNGIHVRRWASPPFRALFDLHIPDWRTEAFNLRYAVGIPVAEVARAHAAAKQALLDEVAARTGESLPAEVFTLGFARRATAYKRADLLFTDLDRLRRIARDVGPIQVLYAGKAHPRDETGKAMIQRVVEAARSLDDVVKVRYLEDYDMTLAGYLCAGVDLWLNTPQMPQEASGTSGMKAALNGVPSLSVLDGWWVEGHVEGVTGWAVGEGWRADAAPTHEAASLYDKLEGTIVPLFYGRGDAYARVMRSAISLNASFFNAERMLLQYATHAYGLPAYAHRAPAAPAVPVL